MFLYKFKIKVSFLLTILFILSACSSSVTKMTEINDDVLSDDYEYKKEILCPKVKFIEGKDKIKFKEETKYEVSFYEVKWKCYSYNDTKKKHTNNNIDLDIKYKIDYEVSNIIFKEEQFSLILVLLNDKNEVIIRNKFNRSFYNKEKLEIINDTNGIISIKLEGKHSDISKYLLLLGLK